MSSKLCSVCKQEKPFVDFHRNKSKKDGYRKECKSCVHRYLSTYREKNKEIISEKGKEYYKLNAERIKDRNSKWQRKNKDYRKEYNKKYRTERLSKDAVFRCYTNTRALIGHSYKYKGIDKNSKTSNILGCSPKWFYEFWLEEKYNPPHSHLDHIVPVSVARDEQEVMLLNHYSNFQVLSASDNVKKGNRYISLQGLNKVLANHPNVNFIKRIIKREGIEVR